MMLVFSTIYPPVVVAERERGCTSRTMLSPFRATDCSLRVLHFRRLKRNILSPVDAVHSSSLFVVAVCHCCHQCPRLPSRVKGAEVALGRVRWFFSGRFLDNVKGAEVEHSIFATLSITSFRKHFYAVVRDWRWPFPSRKFERCKTDRATLWL